MRRSPGLPWHRCSASHRPPRQSIPLLRFPDVHEDSVVFVHAEDIWTAPADGGFARRLTDDEGEEAAPQVLA